MSKEIEFTDGRIDRRYTKEWSTSGFINLEKLPDIVANVLNQRKEMVAYIEALHDKIDWILEKNQCCDVSGCLTAGCGSDHK